MTKNAQVKKLEIRLPRSTQFSNGSINGFNDKGELVISETRKLGYRISDCQNDLRNEFPNAEIVEV